MKKSKIFRRLAAALLAGTMMVAMGTTVFAEGETADDVTVSFTKTLDMTEADGASVPDVTFSYGIEAGEPVLATETTPEILAGVGRPNVGSAVYTHGDTVDENAEVKKTVNVDFSGVTFTKPGIYRYVITEQTSENPDITDDTNKTRYLDVYVVNGDTEGTYAIDDFVLLPSVIIPGNDGVYGDGPTSKSNGYTNMYTTYQLSLNKVVGGAMGNHGETFNFKIDFEGPAYASFTYENENVTLDATGKGSKIISITEGDQVVITGIPSTVKYTITENIDSKKGYTTSYTVKVKGENGVETETEISNTTTATKTMGKTDNAVVCTNVKDAVSPTGIVMNIAPYVLMVAVAAVLAVVFLRKRNNFEN